MEDYLEMIFRTTIKNEYTRISKLADALNVNVSSASKMVSKLKEVDFIEYEKYGIIKLTEIGKEMGQFLLHRHEVLCHFFCIINHKNECQLELIEQIEHYFDRDTINNIEDIINKLTNI